MHNCKAYFCNRLKSKISTEISGEGSLSSDEMISIWFVCASQTLNFFYLNIAMKCCLSSTGKDHRLIKNVFTRVCLFSRDWSGFCPFSLPLFPPPLSLEAGLHYWLQESKCNLVLILLLSVCKLSPFPSLLSAIRNFCSLVPHPGNAYWKWIDLMV